MGRGQRGVYAMIVHDGAFYAATAGSHGGPNVNVEKEGLGRVYRYRGGMQWEDIGQRAITFVLVLWHPTAASCTHSPLTPAVMPASVRVRWWSGLDPMRGFRPASH